MSLEREETQEDGGGVQAEGLHDEIDVFFKNELK